MPVVPVQRQNPNKPQDLPKQITGNPVRDPIRPEGDGQIMGDDPHHNVSLLIYDSIKKLLLKENIQPIVDPHVLIDEYMDSPSSTSLTFINNFSFAILITSMIVSIPASPAVGVLTIGASPPRKIAIGGGIQSGLTNIQMILYPSDIITVTSTVVGDIYLEIMGGRLMNDLWRRQ